MKRFLTFLLIAFIAAAGHAASPFAFEKIFAMDELRSKGHNYVIVTRPDAYFRSVTADNDKPLQKEILKAINKDRKLASGVTESYGNPDGKNCIILSIVRNGYEISVVFTWKDEGYLDLFVSGHPDSFK